MDAIEKFNTAKINKIDLSKISGGNTGIETNTSECTVISSPLGNSAGDTDRDGDWISTCISVPIGQTEA